MIDWDRVSELRTDFGEESFVEIVSMFISEVEEKLDLIENSDALDFSEDYHFLKGGAANLGFADLQNICGRAEASGSPDELAEIQAVFVQSKAMFLAETQQ
ncbi:MAG: Hpt domain-containing protein [Pseudomonadota bacterium]